MLLLEKKSTFFWSTLLVETCLGLLQIHESDWFSHRWLFTDRQRSRARCHVENSTICISFLDFLLSSSTSDSQLGYAC